MSLASDGREEQSWIDSFGFVAVNEKLCPESLVVFAGSGDGRSDSRFTGPWISCEPNKSSTFVGLVVSPIHYLDQDLSSCAFVTRLLALLVVVGFTTVRSI